MSVRVAILVNHPAQHFAEAFRLLSQHPEIQARVYFWHAATEGLPDPGFNRRVRWDTDLHSGYDWWAPPLALAARRWVAALAQLRRDRPQVMLCYGWGSPISRSGIVFAHLTRTPLLYYGDTTSSVSGRHSRLRGVVLRALFRTASGAVSTGVANREFYLSNGLAAERIHPGVVPTNVRSFALAARTRPSGVDRPIVIGFVGKFVAKKAIDDLLHAAVRLPEDRAWQLWLIGDGPLRSHLESLVGQLRLDGRVRFLGFKNTDELPPLVSQLDVLVLPSRQENRGLVAVEAMAAGAVAVVSSATGLWGPGDVVQDGDTGLVYPVGDVAALTSCLRELMEDPPLRERLAAQGQARVRCSGPEDFAATAAAALVSTVRKRAHAAHH